MSDSLRPPRTVASVHGVLQQECWSGLPFPSPGDLPDPGIEPRSPALQVDSLLSEPPGMDQTVKESPIMVSHNTQVTRHWSIHIKANKGRYGRHIAKKMPQKPGYHQMQTFSLETN